MKRKRRHHQDSCGDHIEVAFMEDYYKPKLLRSKHSRRKLKLVVLGREARTQPVVTACRPQESLPLRGW